MTSEKELTWEEIIVGEGIYKAIETHPDGYERYVVVSREGDHATAHVELGSTAKFHNGICYIGFRRHQAHVSPSLMTPGEWGNICVEPIITIHTEDLMWEKCEHLDIRLCLKTED